MEHRTKVAVVIREQMGDFQSAVVRHRSVVENAFEEAGMDLVGELVENLRHIEVVHFERKAETAGFGVKIAALAVGIADLGGETAVPAAESADLVVGIVGLEAETVGLVVGAAVLEVGIAVLQVAGIVEAAQITGY